MDKLKKLLKSIKEYPRNIYWVVSGKAEKERKELLQQLKETQEETQRILVQVRDSMDLNRFRARKASEYFNEVAAKRPEMAEEYKHLAALAATVDTDRMRGRIDAYGPGEEANKEWHLVRERYADEIKRYADAHIDQFIAEDPDRWERIRKNKPEYAPKPPAP